MLITKEKRKSTFKWLSKRLEFVNSKHEIVSNAYNSILNSLDQISIDSHQDYRQ